MKQNIQYLVAVFCYTIGKETDHFSVRYFDADGDDYGDCDRVSQLFPDYSSAQRFANELAEIGHEQASVVSVTVYEE